MMRMNPDAAPALVTTCCADGEPLFARGAAAAQVLAALRRLDEQRRCVLYAAVVMPDHVSFVADPLGASWQSVLGALSECAAPALETEALPPGALWQQHDQRDIWTDAQLVSAVEHCLLNPVRAGLAHAVGDWPFVWSRFDLD